MADRYWVGGTGNWTTTTTNWSATSGGTAGASSPTAADNVFFDANSNIGTGAFTVTVTSARTCLDLTVSPGSSPLDGVMTLAGTFGITVAGNISIPVTNVTTTMTGTITLSATTSKTFNVPSQRTMSYNFNGVGGTWTLLNSLTTTGNITLTAGTLDIANNSIQSATFTSIGTATRSIGFGTAGTATTTGSGTVWNTTPTGFSYTGTSDVRINNTTATATTVTTGAMSAAQALNFNFTAGTYALTLSSGNVYNNLNFTGFGGTVAFAATTHTMYGNLNLGSTATMSANPGIGTFIWNSTAGIRTIRSNGRTANFGISLNGAGQTLQLADAFIQASTQSFFYTAGTFDMATYSTSVGVFTIQNGIHAITNGTVNAASVTHTSGDLAVGTGYLVNCSGTYTFTAGSISINNSVALTTGFFNSNNSNTRNINFGTGKIVLTSNNAVCWISNTDTGLTISGTSRVELNYAGSVGSRSIQTSKIASTAINFYITAGTDTIFSSGDAGFADLNFTGFSGTLGAGLYTIYGNLTITSGMTIQSGASAMTFAATSTGKTINTAGKTFDFPVVFNGVGGSWILQNSLTIGSTRTCTLTNGTLNLNSQTNNLGIFTITTGTHAISNGTLTCTSVSHNSGDLSIGTGYLINCIGTYTFTAGTITINNGVVLAAGAFVSSGSGVRSILFGTGNITLTGSGTIWDTANPANFSYTGTSVVNISNNTATATTINTGTMTAAQVLNFNITTGTYALTLASGSNFNNINFTGFSGSVPLAAATVTVRGNITYSSAMTSSAIGGGIITLAGTGAQTITTNNSSIGHNITVNSSGGTYTLQDTFVSTGAFTLSAGTFTLQAAFTSTNTFTLTAGTLSLGTFTLTTGIFNTTNSNIRSIQFGSGQINLTGNNVNIWDSQTATNLTYTGTSKINATYSGAVGSRGIYPGALTEANALNFNITAGTDIINIYSNFKNIDFTGFSGTFTIISATTLYGNLTIPATAATSASSSVMSFAGTAAIAVTQILNTNGVIIRWPMTMTGTAIVQLSSNLNQLSTQSFTFTNGTLDINSKTTSLGIFTITTGTHAITNGTLTCASVSHNSGDLSIGTGYLINSIGTYTFTAGTITINNSVVLSAGAFVSSGSGVRSILFGTGNITLTGSGTIWDTSNPANFSYTGTSAVNISNNTATAATMTLGTMSVAQALNFNITTGTYALSISGTTNNLNFTGFSGSVPLAAAALTVRGNITYSSAMTSSAIGGGIITLAGTGTQTITTNNNASIGHNITVNSSGGTYTLQDAFNGTGSWTISAGTFALQAAFTCTSTFTLTAGTLSLGTFTLTTNIFNTTGSSTRSIQFGTGQINLTGNSIAIWDSQTATNLTYSGTSKINATYSGAVGTRGIYPGALSEVNALNFNVTAGTDIINIYGNFKNIDFTGFSGTIGLISATTLYGNLTIPATAATTTSVSGFIMTFAGTTAVAVTQIVNTNGVIIRWPMTMNGTAGIQLSSNFTQLSTLAFAFTNGTLDINSKTTSLGIFTITTGTHSIANGTLNCASVSHNSGDLSIGTGYLINCIGTYTFTAGTITINNGVTLTTSIFNTTNSNIRSIAFGTGQINLIGNNATIWDSTTATNLTYSGTSKINATYSGAVGTRNIYPGASTETNALNFNITAGTDIINIYGNFKNIDFTGFSGSITLISATTLYGNLTIPATATTSGTGFILTFSGTTAIAVTQILNTNGVSITWPITMAGTAGIQLNSTFTQPSTTSFTLTTGTLNLNNQTNNFGIFTITTGTHAISNGTVTCASVSHNSGDLSIGTGYLINCIGIYTFTAGTITINNSVALASGTFNTNSTSVRSILFGTGNITLTGSGTIWNSTNTSNFSYTGTSNVNISNNTATATTITTGAMSAAQALNFNITTGTYALTTTTSNVFNNLNFTGFSGTYAQVATTITVNGDLTFSSGMTSTTSTGSLTIGGLNTTYINGNGHSAGCNIIITKGSSTAQVWLGSAFTSTLANGFSFTVGVFNTQNYNLTLNTFSSIGASARTLTLGSSQVTVTGSGTTAWNTDASLTVSASTATISMTSAIAKTFIGSGKTWFKLNQGGLGDLNITGNNTFNDITNTAQPSIIYFPSGGTTTVSNFSLKGTYGKLTSITSTPSTHTLTKASGIISVNYCNISKSIATGGASWRAYTSEGNVDSGTNTGWIFKNPNNPSNFLSFFL